MVEEQTREEEPKAEQTKVRKASWLSILSWGVAVVMVALMAFVLVQRIPGVFASSGGDEVIIPEQSGEVQLPEFQPQTVVNSVVRPIELRTKVSEKDRQWVERYTVQPGDSIFSIANEYKLKPESVLWANTDKLQDDPQMVEIGLTLYVPPVDGVFYKWKDGDTLDSVASKYKAKVEDILLWPSNKLDITNPVIAPGSFVMIPGGRGEFRTWVVPTYFRPSSGANRSINSQCSTFDNGAGGTGSFIWPTTSSHTISGNDYWEGHLGIDIGASTGDTVVASDSGWVVYAGGIGGGYGNMVMIDHGNGYFTLYAHNSQILVRCGQYVNQGNAIAYAGSTGNSTGPHLHFEVRYNDQFINPWQVIQ